MRTEVKICGLSDAESIEAALEAGADYIGFAFFERSPRNVTLDRATALAARARGKAGIVALTVDAADALLAEIAEELRPDFLQLHGSETSARVADIRARTHCAVIKVVGVAASTDLDGVPSCPADRYLLDAKPPRGATRPGGLGRTFDWTMLDGFAPPAPWFLAGGLTCENVAEALSIARPTGVDVSSAVESAPGRKDPALIHAFITAVRAVERPLRRAAGSPELRA
jgi:phosphoribosylanthranilate isomerase